MEPRLTSAAIRLPCPCNIRCKYCYGNKAPKGIPFDRVIDFCVQAVALGAKVVSIVGEGEPLIYAQMRELVDFLAERDVHTVIYSNLILMDEDLALFFRDRPVSLVGKQNSFDHYVEDYIVGRRGAAAKMEAKRQLLLDLGFTQGEQSRFSIHGSILKENIGQLPDMWRLMREQRILPQFQYPCATGKDDDWLNGHLPGPQEAGALFRTLRDIDNEFGFDWIPRPPIAPYGCSVVYTSCGLRPNGDISMCAYTDFVLGNILEQPLADIIASTNARMMRNIRGQLKGKCGDCVVGDKTGCYGCRADVVALGSSVDAEYEACWN